MPKTRTNTGYRTRPLARNMFFGSLCPDNPEGHRFA